MTVAAVNPWCTNTKVCLAWNITYGVPVLSIPCPIAEGTVLGSSCKRKSALSLLLSGVSHGISKPIQVKLQYTLKEANPRLFTEPEE